MTTTVPSHICSFSSCNLFTSCWDIASSCFIAISRISCLESVRIYLQFKNPVVLFSHLRILIKESSRQANPPHQLPDADLLPFVHNPGTLLSYHSYTSPRQSIDCKHLVIFIYISPSKNWLPETFFLLPVITFIPLTSYTFFLMLCVFCNYIPLFSTRYTLYTAKTQALV